MTEKQESFLIAKDVAELLNCSVYHVYRLKKMGMPYKKVGTSLRFLKSEIDDWINRRTKDGILKKGGLPE